jgi:hypothetical protein
MDLSKLNKYTVGDRIAIRIRLRLKDETGTGPDNIASTSFLAGLVLTDGSALAAGTSQVSCTVIDEPTAVVEAVFPAAMTGSIVPGVYHVEVEGTDSNGPVTYERDSILIQPGKVGA